MGSMLLKRVLAAIPSLIGVVIVTFLLTRALPGDPAAYFAGPAATKEAIEQIRAKLGLDQPLVDPVRRAMSAILRTAISARRSPPASRSRAEIRARLPASAELTLLGLIVSIVDRRSARHHGGDATGLARSTIPAASSPPPACRCRCSSPG